MPSPMVNSLLAVKGVAVTPGTENRSRIAAALLPLMRAALGV